MNLYTEYLKRKGLLKKNYKNRDALLVSKPCLSDVVERSGNRFNLIMEEHDIQISWNPDLEFQEEELERLAEIHEILHCLPNSNDLLRLLDEMDRI